MHRRLWQEWVCELVSYSPRLPPHILLLFLIVREDPTDKEYPDSNDQDGYDDTRGGSHFFN